MMWRRVKCRQKYDVCPALVPCACTTLLPLSLSHGLYSLSRGLGPFECPSLSAHQPPSFVPLFVSLCLCLWLSVSLNLSVPLQCHSVSLSLSLNCCPYFSLSPSLFLRPFVSVSLSLCHSVSVPVPFLCLCLGPSPSVCLSPFPVLFYPFKHVQLRNKNSKLILYILTLIPCTVLTESCITNRIFNRAKMFHNQIL